MFVFIDYDDIDNVIQCPILGFFSASHDSSMTVECCKFLVYLQEEPSFAFLPFPNLGTPCLT